MPILAPSTTTIMSGNMIAAGMLGVSQFNLASAISTGFVNYIRAAVTVTTADVGVLGAGVGLGPGGLILAPNILFGALTGTFSGAGINGPFRTPLVTAIANSISQSLLTAVIQTNSAGVGLGSGIVVTLAPNSSAHISSMIGSFNAHNIQGSMSNAMAAAIAVGIDASLPSSRGVVAVVGSPSIIPAAGVGIGRVI